MGNNLYADAGELLADRFLFLFRGYVHKCGTAQNPPQKCGDVCAFEHCMSAFEASTIQRPGRSDHVRNTVSFGKASRTLSNMRENAVHMNNIGLLTGTKAGIQYPGCRW